MPRYENQPEVRGVSTPIPILSAHVKYICSFQDLQVFGSIHKGLDSEKSTQLLSPLSLKEALVLRVRRWTGKPLPSHGLQIRHKVSNSIAENVPLLVLKPHCIPQSSLRPKAEHRTCTCEIKAMGVGCYSHLETWVACLWMRVCRAASGLRCLLVYGTKVILHWYTNRLQSNS